MSLESSVLGISNAIQDHSHYQLYIVLSDESTVCVHEYNCRYLIQNACLSQYAVAWNRGTELSLPWRELDSVWTDRVHLSPWFWTSPMQITLHGVNHYRYGRHDICFNVFGGPSISKIEVRVEFMCFLYLLLWIYTGVPASARYYANLVFILCPFCKNKTLDDK